MKKIEMKESKIQELEDERMNNNPEPVKVADPDYDDFERELNDFIANYDEDEKEDSLEDFSDEDLSDETYEEDDSDEDDSDEDEGDDDEYDDSDIAFMLFEDSLEFLDDMVGMEHIKAKLLRLGRYSLWMQKLEAEGVNTGIYPCPNLTFMFLGDPGTGKTTVAKRMGEILHSAGLLSGDEVHEYRREDLVGQNYGCEEENTKEALRQSAGGVLFLDEAYQCFKQSTDKRDPGYHILETLMAHFDKPDRCIIMAGYKNEMHELFNVNPGFRSRIPDDNIIEFTGPSEQLLLDVANNSFQKMHLQLSPEAETLLTRHIHDLWMSKTEDFGNARVIRQLTESVVINHANRIMTTPQSEDYVITEQDIKQSIPQKQPKRVTRSRIGFV